MKNLFYSFIVLSVIATGTAWWGTATFTQRGPLQAPVTLVFPTGDHFTNIVDTLAENSIIAHPFWFKALAFVRGESAHFKAGEYIFPPHISGMEVSYMMANNKIVVHHLTVPEGLMASEILTMVKQAPVLEGEITLDIKEGELLPETYNYTRGDKRNDILTRMRHAMQKELEEAWGARASDLPFATPPQALILASIVEKETSIKAERPHVASVYINRLKKGMLLQADPTTAYAVTQGKHKLDRPLTTADLLTDSPYNTYRAMGLPPGPIANPGKASIYAVLHPIVSDDLYFVATGIGGHNFARTPEEHAENVKKYHAQLAH